MDLVSVPPFAKPWQLYDLEEDPKERNDLVRDRPEVVARLEATLEGIRAAEDGTLPGSSTLKSLSLAGIDIGPFDPSVLTYEAAVPPGVSTVMVTAIPAATDAVVSILGHGNPRGRRQVQLDGSTVKIKVTVTSPDESATTRYTVTLRQRVPMITGTARVDETLTVDTSAITDPDGLANASFTYQWVRSDRNAYSAIVGATGATYVLVDEDEGNAIRVRVFFTDDAGNDEMRSSPTTPTVRLPENMIVWESELTAGQQNDVLPVVSGYSIYGDLGGNLIPDKFVIDGTSYEIRYLVQSRESLWLSLNRELPADFTLRVGDSTYFGSASMDLETVDMAGYWWSSVSPEWLEGDTLDVSLIIHPGIVLGDRQKAPVTGSFRNTPSEHGGSEDFSFRIYFSEGVATTAEALRERVLSVSGGTVSSVKAVGDENTIWTVSITPDSRGTAVTIEVEPDLNCELSNAICTPDGRRLVNQMEFMVEAREWHAPTGAPTISGRVEVGETLTVDTSGIADGDGLTGATFSYQWVSYDGKADTDIQGATDATYTLVSADEGRAYRVRVSFTDDAGYAESLNSALAVSERPYRLATAVTDGTVVLTWKLPAGWPYTSIYRILRNRPELGETEPLVYVERIRARSNTFTDANVEPEVLYVYRVNGVDYFGYPQAASEPVEVRATETTPAENSPATGAPTISGTVQVGETLTADVSGIADADGLESTTFAYRWITSDGGTDTDVAGATGSTYSLTDSEAGKDAKVRVSFTDDAGNSETLTSEAVYVPFPLTAEFLGVPASHDGESAFTFELSFSVEPNLGFENVRDDALSVTEGDVTSVRRTDPDSDTPNHRWEITVEPDGNNDVTVVLPPTTNCRVDSAVCTAGGNMLSNRVTITVPGPIVAKTAATGRPGDHGVNDGREHADRRHIQHQRRQRHRERHVHLSVAPLKHRHIGRRQLDLHRRQCGRGPRHHGTSVLHRRRRVQREPDQRRPGHPCHPARSTHRRLHRASQPRRFEHHVHVPAPLQRGTQTRI